MRRDSNFTKMTFEQIQIDDLVTCPSSSHTWTVIAKDYDRQLVTVICKDNDGEDWKVTGITPLVLKFAGRRGELFYREHME